METQREAADLREKAQALATALERQANASSSYLRAGAVLFATLEDVSEPVFRHYASELRAAEGARGDKGMGWAPRIPRSDIPEYNRRIAQVYGTGAALNPALAHDRQFAVPVTYLYPAKESVRPALGYDMFSESTRREAMRKAWQMGQPVTSAKVALKPDTPQPKPGFLIYMPVIRQTPSGPQLKGFVYSPFDAKEFLAYAIKTENADNLKITLYDGSIGPDRVLAGVWPREVRGASISRRLSVAHRSWTIVVQAPHDVALSPLSLASLLFGMLVATLLMIVVRLITQSALEDQHTIARFEEQNSIRNSLTRELNHRVKNTLANVLSLISLTHMRAKDLDSFVDGLKGRIRALSATHDLLTQSNWGMTPLRSLVSAELAPYMLDNSEAIELSGPDIELAPNEALSLGLAFHELATNAAKYGALSVPGGKIRVEWEMLSGNRAQISWAETGGPMISRSPRPGFGTALVEKVVASELGDKVDLRFERDGVRCTIAVPLRSSGEFNMRDRT